MGLFSGGNRTDQNTTNVYTDTRTSIRDIGFTGDQALQMAGLLENANIARQQLQYDSMQSFNDWVQSTNDLSIRAASQTGRDILGATSQAGQDILYANQDTGANILSAVSGAFDGLLRGVTDFLSSASYTTEVTQEAASSAQQSAYELQRQATGAQGPALTPNQDVSTIAKQITIVVLGVVAIGFIWRTTQ